MTTHDASLRGVILAAGFATRMYPLTKTVAKPLLEIGGEPLATRLVRQIEATGSVSEIVVVTNGRFADDFGAWRDELVAHSTTRLPMTLVDNGVTRDDEHRGALADLALALDSPSRGNATGHLVVAGDNLLTFDLAPYATRFAAHDEPLLLLRSLDKPYPPNRYSDVTIDAQGIVTSFREKPDDPRGLSAIAVYFLPQNLRALLDSYLTEGGNRDAPGHFLAWLAQHQTVRAEPFAGGWYDIGNLEQLAEARRALG